MKANLIEQAYAVAKERYAAIGVDTDAVLEQLQKQQLSLHCWQTDDVVGFERNDALSGGIQTTGNYPGRARNYRVREDPARRQPPPEPPRDLRRLRRTVRRPRPGRSEALPELD